MTTIGVPRETKADEYRVALLPSGVAQLTRAGHVIVVEARCGNASGYSDETYEAAGARIVDSAEEVWRTAQLILKVKEPQPHEFSLMRPHQEVFTFFHFASDPELTHACLASRITAIAYETLEAPTPSGRMGLPLLMPMSEVAGRMAIQSGARCLESPLKGRGVLLGGVPGVEAGHVLIVGGGAVGTQAAFAAAGLGAQVTLLDIDIERLRLLAGSMPPNVQLVYSDPDALRRYLRHADLVIGAVLIPGAKAPMVISREDLRIMQPGAVIVDVAVDQGGCVETTRPTTHADPIFLEEGIVHYCVANIPGVVARSSSQALCNATLEWVRKLADVGAEGLGAADPGFRKALNMMDGRLLYGPIAEAHGLSMD